MYSSTLVIFTYDWCYEKKARVKVWLCLRLLRCKIIFLLNVYENNEINMKKVVPITIV